MRSRTLPLVLTAGLLAGCTGTDDGSGGDGATVTLSAPGEQLTLVADEDPAAASVSTSRALFERSGVAVVADADDRAGTLLGSSAAVGLGVPLLVVGADAEPLTAELERLGATHVLAVGEVELTAEEREVLAVPASAEAVEQATGLEFAGDEEVPADGDAPAVAGLTGDPVVALRGEEPAPGGSVDGSLPPVERADPLEDVLVLATGESVAGIATARAAGAQVVLTGTTDPRASADVVSALAEAPNASVVALGAGFAAEEGLDWKTATAATGEQLPGGGQTLFPGRLIVALYGHPGTSSLGLLGEQDLDGAITRAQEVAAPYEEVVDTPVVPAFEVIATVASSSAGEDGDYSYEAPVEQLRPWVEAAGEAGLYVVLDLQPGRTDFLTQAKRYQELLELPHVGLALDPEWRLRADQVHLTEIGQVGVDEVNQVITWLADLTRENALPQKLLVLHQFQLRMLPGRESVDLTRDELAVMIHADGQGAPGDKLATWAALRAGAQPELAWGWKNFIDEDLPMLSPAETIARVSPTPQLISYQ
ncbi:hypothetical protein DQ244_05310 [Blastococcus sp. TBT05-19]|uniref:hypothetical protein n=1 Tax=Blastococcus sp. TBT05-19 TaxID=2250581 RepID=UPI000DE8C288|nr:hypothetical protein [Blastococcus sp. TBT05-19]RBY94697.1 hypothetical protein DQ244_05310 [Blastococcus sp. TBT05-19]